MKSFNKSESCINHIKGEEWKTYFCELLNIATAIDDEFAHNVEMFMAWHGENCEECNNDLFDSNDTINKDITLVEVEKAIDSLDRKKPPVIDGITNDILKNTKLVIVPMLCSLFNKILEDASYPDEWCSAIIYPIHKKGDVILPKQYRGISLLSCISKLFMYVKSAPFSHLLL